MAPERVPPEVLRESYDLPGDDEALLAECDVTAWRASGPGGQHRNTSFTAVRLHHRPSGLVVIGRRERSRTRNLRDAVTRLRDRLRNLLTPPVPRRATRPPRASKARRLEEKRRRGRTKRERSGDWEG